jgi:hypothetical protein
MAVLKTGVVNVKWDYQNKSMPGYTQPFEVPEDIVNPMRNETKAGVALSDFVNVGDGQSLPLMQVKTA